MTLRCRAVDTIFCNDLSGEAELENTAIFYVLAWWSILSCFSFCKVRNSLFFQYNEIMSARGQLALKISFDEKALCFVFKRTIYFFICLIYYTVYSVTEWADMQKCSCDLKGKTSEGQPYVTTYISTYLYHYVIFYQSQMRLRKSFFLTCQKNQRVLTKRWRWDTSWACL